jgi:predicted DNA-binding protein YlxM (UPF0122 family)
VEKINTISIASIRNVLKRNGIKINRITIPSDVRIKIEEMYLNGFDVNTIANLLDVPLVSVEWFILKTHRIISFESKRQIIRMYIEETKSSDNIAGFFKISKQSVLRVLKQYGIKIRNTSQANVGLNDREYEKYIENLPEYEKYRRKVYSLTRAKNKYIKLLPNYEKRGGTGVVGAYHLDHKFSISKGFGLSIPPEIIANIHNLEFMPWKNNISKNGRCSITLEELYQKINHNGK